MVFLYRYRLVRDLQFKNCYLIRLQFDFLKKKSFLSCLRLAAEMGLICHFFSGDSVNNVKFLHFIALILAVFL